MAHTCNFSCGAQIDAVCDWFALSELRPGQKLRGSRVSSTQEPDFSGPVASLLFFTPSLENVKFLHY